MEPFTQRRSESVTALGESRLISAIKRWLHQVNPPSPYGIGDDCAVLAASLVEQVITVDPVIFGRHFDAQVSPWNVGAKLLKRNLSDLAAMGAQPTCGVVALVLDSTVKTAWLERFYRGLASTARRFGVAIVGGDIAQAPGALTASLTLLGRATTKRLVTRQGAKLGDSIYVTGRLGGSLLGQHYRFTPRLKEGAWLARQDDVCSMMDLSDGLAKDLHALTPKGTRPALSSTAVPIAAAARKLARESKRSSLNHALTDGEDYELLFTLARKADRRAFERAWKKSFKTSLACIGEFIRVDATRGGEIVLEDYLGYEHLRKT